MELFAVVALFAGLALLAAIPLVLLLHFTQRPKEGELIDPHSAELG
jgi:hypothetical protein